MMPKEMNKMKIKMKIELMPKEKHNKTEDVYIFFGGRIIIMWATIDSAQVNIKRLLKR